MTLPDGTVVVGSKVTLNSKVENAYLETLPIFPLNPEHKQSKLVWRLNKARRSVCHEEELEQSSITVHVIRDLTHWYRIAHYISVP